MIRSFARRASHGAACRSGARSPGRRGSAPRAGRCGSSPRMSDHELSDIGLVRQDIVDAAVLRPDADPSAMLARRRGRARAPLAGARDRAA